MSGDIGRFVRARRRNAVLSWLLVGLILAAAGVGLLRGDLLWTGFAGVVACLAVLPPVALRDRRAMLPWEVTGVAALPVLGRAFATVPITGNLATYLSVAAIALVVAVELHLFTPVRMNDAFALGLVVVATMATAGLWAVVRWSADLLLGTTFLLDPTVDETVVERRLMWEFVASTVAGLGAGIAFAYYVRYRIDPEVRVPPEAVASDLEGNAGGGRP